MSERGENIERFLVRINMEYTYLQLNLEKSTRKRKMEPSTPEPFLEEQEERKMGKWVTERVNDKKEDDIEK